MLHGTSGEVTSGIPTETESAATMQKVSVKETVMLKSIVASNARNAGRSIQVPTYDFCLHTRTSATTIFMPDAFVVVEGLFALYWPELRRLLGTAVYVDMSEDVCRNRRTERDVRERGRTPESVAEQFRTTVAPMARRYIGPTRIYADLVLSGEAPIADGVDRVLDHVRRQLAQVAPAIETLLAHPR